MINLQIVLEELSRFEKDLNTFFDPVSPKDISNAEEKLGYKFPADYIDFLKFSNGAYILCELIYGFNTKNIDLDGISSYVFERYEAGNPIDDHLFPISPDGRGNHFCLDLRTLTDDMSTCKVVFWQHDFLYSADDTPDVDSDSFPEFIKKIMDVYLEDNNYDGSEK